MAWIENNAQQIKRIIFKGNIIKQLSETCNQFCRISLGSLVNQLLDVLSESIKYQRFYILLTSHHIIHMSLWKIFRKFVIMNSHFCNLFRLYFTHNAFIIINLLIFMKLILNCICNNCDYEIIVCFGQFSRLTPFYYKCIDLYFDIKLGLDMENY